MEAIGCSHDEQGESERARVVVGEREYDLVARIDHRVSAFGAGSLKP
jgi:hypothetical protein